MKKLSPSDGALVEGLVAFIGLFLILFAIHLFAENLPS